MNIMLKAIGFTIVVHFGFYVHPGLSQNTYFPLQIGNEWIYEELADNQFYGENTMTIIDTVIENNTKYFLFDRFFFVRGLQDSVLFRSDGQKIIRRVGGVEQVWFDLGAQVNDVWTIEVFDFDLNDTVQTEIILASKNSKYEVNGRTFENCYIFSFNPPATDLSWSYVLAPDVGCIQYIISTLVPRSYHFREGLINGVDYPNLVAQSDTTIIFHYPLHIGDFWEYEYVLSGQLFAVERREVIGDTLMSNGKTYRIIDTDFPLSAARYQRIDSMRVFQFSNDEFLLYKLRIQPGDTWDYSLSPSDSGYFEVTQIADTSLWSHNFKFARIESFILPDSSQGIASEEFILADSIGVLFHGFEGGFLRLSGAIINGKKFGTLVSVSENRQNTQNKPGVFQLKVYPNPTIENTHILIEGTFSSPVEIKIFDLLGRTVRTLFYHPTFSGKQNIVWDGTDQSNNNVASGIYFIFVNNQSKFSLQKVALIR